MTWIKTDSWIWVMSHPVFSNGWDGWIHIGQKELDNNLSPVHAPYLITNERAVQDPKERVSDFTKDNC